jgi:hypothetical protein
MNIQERRRRREQEKEGWELDVPKRTTPSSKTHQNRSVSQPLKLFPASSAASASFLKKTKKSAFHATQTTLSFSQVQTTF